MCLFRQLLGGGGGGGITWEFFTIICIGYNELLIYLPYSEVSLIVAKTSKKNPTPTPIR